jgi:hypothetical protein
LDLDSYECDGQTDLEPSLGWPDGRPTQLGGMYGTEDLEDEHDGREPDPMEENGDEREPGLVVPEGF